jgi:hypothetical protein
MGKTRLRRRRTKANDDMWDSVIGYCSDDNAALLSKGNYQSLASEGRRDLLDFLIPSACQRDLDFSKGRSGRRSVFGRERDHVMVERGRFEAGLAPISKTIHNRQPSGIMKSRSAYSHTDSTYDLHADTGAETRSEMTEFHSKAGLGESGTGNRPTTGDEVGSLHNAMTTGSSWMGTFDDTATRDHLDWQETEAEEEAESENTTASFFQPPFRLFPGNAPFRIFPGASTDIESRSSYADSQTFGSRTFTRDRSDEGMPTVTDTGDRKSMTHQEATGDRKSMTDQETEDLEAIEVVPKFFPKEGDSQTRANQADGSSLESASTRASNKKRVTKSAIGPKATGRQPISKKSSKKEKSKPVGSLDKASQSDETSQSSGNDKRKYGPRLLLCGRGSTEDRFLVCGQRNEEARLLAEEEAWAATTPQIAIFDPMPMGEGHPRGFPQNGFHGFTHAKSSTLMPLQAPADGSSSSTETLSFPRPPEPAKNSRIDESTRNRNPVFPTKNERSMPASPPISKALLVQEQRAAISNRMASAVAAAKADPHKSPLHLPVGGKIRPISNQVPPEKTISDTENQRGENKFSGKKGETIASGNSGRAYPIGRRIAKIGTEGVVSKDVSLETKTPIFISNDTISPRKKTMARLKLPPSPVSRKSATNDSSTTRGKKSEKPVVSSQASRKTSMNDSSITRGKKPESHTKPPLSHATRKSAMKSATSSRGKKPESSMKPPPQSAVTRKNELKAANLESPFTKAKSSYSQDRYSISQGTEGHFPSTTSTYYEFDAETDQNSLLLNSPANPTYSAILSPGKAAPQDGSVYMRKRIASREFYPTFHWQAISADEVSVDLLSAGSY